MPPLEIQVFSPSSTYSSPSSGGLARHGRDIGAGIGLGQGEGRDGFAAAHAREVSAFLRFAAEQGDGAAAQALHGKGEIRQPRMARQDLANQANGARVDSVADAAVRDSANRMFQPARLSQLLDQGAANGVDVMFGPVRDILRGPGIEPLRQ